jgi:nitroreductase
MIWRNEVEPDKTIKGRRSIRRYRDEDIPDSVIEELLDLARYAPSSMNGQPWCFIVVRNDETKRRLAEIKNKHCPAEKRMYKADFLQNAPVVVVVCVDRERSFNRGVENAVLAAANIMLGAYGMGIGTVYMSAYRHDDPGISEEIRQTLGIPRNVDPITIIPLGYPGETPEPKTMRSLDEAVFYETFGKK